MRAHIQEKNARERACLDRRASLFFFHHTLKKLLFRRAGVHGLSSTISSRPRERRTNNFLLRRIRTFVAPPPPSFVLVFPSSGLKISTLRGKLCWRHSARAWPSNFSVESSIKHGQLLSVWRSVGREKHLNSTRIEFCNLLALTLIYDSIFALLRIKIKYQENYYPFRHSGLDQSMFCL